MKQKKIITEKATILVKDLMPEIVEFNVGTILIDGDKYRCIGAAKEVLEYQWKEIVEQGKDFVTEETHYLDYGDDSALLLTAKQSGLSLLKANGVLLNYDRPFIPDTLSESFTNVDH